MKCSKCGEAAESKDGKPKEICKKCGTRIIIPKYLNQVECKGIDDEGNACKEVIEITDLFCGECGNVIFKEWFKIPSQQHPLCSKCGKELDNAKRLCKSCGLKNPSFVKTPTERQTTNELTNRVKEDEEKNSTLNTEVNDETIESKKESLLSTIITMSPTLLISSGNGTNREFRSEEGTIHRFGINPDNDSSGTNSTKLSGNNARHNQTWGCRDSFNDSKQLEKTHEHANKYEYETESETGHSSDKNIDVDTKYPASHLSEDRRTEAAEHQITSTLHHRIKEDEEVKSLFNTDVTDEIKEIKRERESLMIQSRTNEKTLSPKVHSGSVIEINKEVQPKANIRHAHETNQNDNNSDTEETKSQSDEDEIFYDTRSECEGYVDGSSALESISASEFTAKSLDEEGRDQLAIKTIKTTDIHKEYCTETNNPQTIQVSKNDTGSTQRDVYKFDEYSPEREKYGTKDKNKISVGVGTTSDESSSVQTHFTQNENANPNVQLLRETKPSQIGADIQQLDRSIVQNITPDGETDSNNEHKKEIFEYVNNAQNDKSETEHSCSSPDGRGNHQDKKQKGMTVKTLNKKTMVTLENTKSTNKKCETIHQKEIIDNTNNDSNELFRKIDTRSSAAEATPSLEQKTQSVKQSTEKKQQHYRNMKCSKCGEAAESKDGKPKEICKKCGTRIIIPKYLNQVECKGIDDEGNACKEVIEITDLFCGECGNVIFREWFKIPSQQHPLCSKCGKELDNAKRLCKSCGLRNPSFVKTPTERQTTNELTNRVKEDEEKNSTLNTEVNDETIESKKESLLSTIITMSPTLLISSGNGTNREFWSEEGTIHRFGINPDNDSSGTNSTKLSGNNARHNQTWGCRDSFNDSKQLEKTHEHANKYEYETESETGHSSDKNIDVDTKYPASHLSEDRRTEAAEHQITSTLHHRIKEDEEVKSLFNTYITDEIKAIKRERESLLIQSRTNEKTLSPKVHSGSVIEINKEVQPKANIRHAHETNQNDNNSDTEETKSQSDEDEIFYDTRSECEGYVDGSSALESISASEFTAKSLDEEGRDQLAIKTIKTTDIHKEYCTETNNPQTIQVSKNDTGSTQRDVYKFDEYSPEREKYGTKDKNKISVGVGTTSDESSSVQTHFTQNENANPNVQLLRETKPSQIGADIQQLDRSIVQNITPDGETDSNNEHKKEIFEYVNNAQNDKSETEHSCSSPDGRGNHQDKKQKGMTVKTLNEKTMVTLENTTSTNKKCETIHQKEIIDNTNNDLNELFRKIDTRSSAAEATPSLEQKTQSVKQSTEKKQQHYRGVTFNVIVPPEFEMKAKDQVAVCFQHKDLCDKESHHTFQSKRVCKITEGNNKLTYLVCRGKIQIPDTALKSQLKYSYCVVNKSKTEQTFECLPPSRTSRWLSYTEGMTDVYDGVIVHSSTVQQPKGFIRRVSHKVGEIMTGKKNFDIREKFDKEVQLSFQEFIPPASTYVKTLTQSYVKTVSIIDGLFEAYRSWFTNISKGYITSLIAAVLNDRMQQLISSKESNQRAVERMVFGVISALLCKDIHLHQHEYQTLFHAMKIRPNQNVCHDYDGLLKCFGHDKQLSDRAFQTLLSMCNYVASTFADPSWIYCLPLIHFYFDDVKPFRCPDSRDMDHESEAWWGLAHVGKSVEAFKKHWEWEIPMRLVLENIKPMFEADYMLQRSFVGALNIKLVCECMAHFEIEQRTALANVFFFLKTGYMLSDQQDIVYILHRIRRSFEENTDCRNRNEMNHNRDAFSICKQIATYLSNRPYKTRQTHWAMLLELYLCVLLVASKLNGNSDTFDDVNREIFANDVSTSVENLLRFLKENKPPCSHKNIKVWDKLYALQLPEELRTFFTAQTNEQFEKALAVVANDIRINIYCQHRDSYCKEIQICLDKIVYQDIEELLTNLGKQSQKYWTWGKNAQTKYKLLLSQKFNEKWSVFRNAKKSSLHMCLEWPPFQSYLRNLDAMADVFNKDCLALLRETRALLSDNKVLLKEGRITIDAFKNLLPNKETFCELVAISDRELDELQLLFQRREREVDMLDRQTKAVELLLTRFNSINEELHPKKIGTYEINEKCLRVKNTKEMTFEDFCVTRGETYIHYYHFSNDMQHVLEHILQRHTSHTLKQMWLSVGKIYFQDQQMCTSFEDSAKKMIELVQPKWDALKDRILTQSISVDEAMFLFDDNTERDVIVPELVEMGLSEEIANQFEYAIATFRIHERSKRFANAVLLLSDTYDIKGNFEEITPIAKQQVSRDQKLKEYRGLSGRTIPENVLNVMENECRIIEVFNSCHKVVKWIKQNVGDKRTWRVFVELSSIHAGESAADMARIRCFDSAVTGFTPLIFGLDEVFGYEDVCRQCQMVWKALKSDDKLADKLKDVSNNHKWYENIQKHIGSDEVSSMEQANEINENGVYCVGYLADTKLRIQDKGEFDLVNILRLTIPQDNDDEKKEFTYDELQNLQSRLMLIAGNEEKEKETSTAVEKYIQVFDSVVRLANVYRKLCSTGCILFQNWKALIWCSSSCPTCVFLEFGKGVEEKLAWKREEDKDVSYVTPKLAKFMENCLDKWTSYINTERSCYRILNFYTMDQLVILQRELVHVGIRSDPSNRVYALLSYIKMNCNKADIIQAMKKAIVQLKKQATEALSAMELSRTDLQIDDDVNDPDEIRTIVKDVIGAGFSERTALEAIKAVGPMSILEIMEWVNDNEGRIRDEEERENEFKGWCENSHSTIRVPLRPFSIGEKTNPTEDDLGQIWDIFINSFESTVKEFISLKHLCCILQCLSTLNTVTVHRKLSPILRERHPNLLLCSGENILKDILSIYMTDQGQPLPLPEEVLLCRQHTSQDQVDIFLRRALFDSNGKIHCLVEPEMLTFSVDDTCERQLEKYVLESKDIPYRFVVLSSSTSTKQSRIVAALEKYTRQGINETDKSIQKYLKHKLTLVDRDLKKNPPYAAVVDEDKCCIRLIKSSRTGLGKTLMSKRITESLSGRTQTPVENLSTIISLQETNVDIYGVCATLLEHTRHPDDDTAHVFRIDVSQMVETGIDYLLFNLCILGCVMDKQGYIWRRKDCDLYLIEITTNSRKSAQPQQHLFGDQRRTMLNLLPDVWCKSPLECLKSSTNSDGHCFDMHEFESDLFQTPISYLAGYDQDKLGQKIIERNPEKCLGILLRHCGIKSPSWAELTQFVKFFGTQLKDFECSIFCGDIASQDLPGFATFVLRFLIQMSRDFSTRSLNIGEETEEGDDGDIALYAMKRTWESSPHPYIFFNPDHQSMTFLGFHINNKTLDLEDSRTGQVLQDKIMNIGLFTALTHNQVPTRDNFDTLSREEKLDRICRVMGNEDHGDPDVTYELTTDNAKKILAIYMRLRCDIPVVVMGETGSGKTRLISFMCQLQIPKSERCTDGCESDLDQDNRAATCMIIAKIHGGIKASDIIKSVEKAEKVAEQNAQRFKDRIYTVLFLDEANSTECIGLIKEIMCDKSIQGRPIKMSNNLRIVAACNPYRKHSDELIKRMEEAGLGYHVDSEMSNDRFGRITKKRILRIVFSRKLPDIDNFADVATDILSESQDFMTSTGETPMRRLVYRVKRLPQSLIPLVWDFGQLDSKTERLYIKQIVRSYVTKNRLPGIDNFADVATDILSESQDFMRHQQDECSFVSLRDVDRTLSVMEWFYNTSNTDGNVLFAKMDELLQEKEADYHRMKTTVEINYESLSYEDTGEEEISEEFSFVPLRDVDTTLAVMERSYNTSSKDGDVLFGKIDERLEETEADYHRMKTTGEINHEPVPYEDTGDEEINDFKLDTVTRCLLLAIGVCYHSCLRKRFEYRQMIANHFKHPCSLPAGHIQFEHELKACQEVFLNHVNLDRNIAKNTALRENLFMMVLCIELRIPLFLIGKPGSSKSLAKTIVSDAMRGISTENELFSTLKQVQMVSYQCSPQSTAEGVMALFRQCAEFQLDKDLDRYAAVVVLDEVGLAEDSPKMPLKSLHFMLETGYQADADEETDQSHAKVGFIGISNWALDPAKMNRGIMVQRDLPDIDELEESASGICAACPRYVNNLFKPMANAYNEIVSKEWIKREFFGLRDFYSLIKMVQAFAEEAKRVPTQSQMKHAILRNFGGVDTQEPYEIFLNHVEGHLREDGNSDLVPDCTPAGLIQHSLRTSGVGKGQSRYLLLLTENLSMVNLFKQRVFKLDSAITIYGSSFPSDLDFTQICRNINKIKICMETGSTVILLNLENIYESLYDALNQYYSYFGVDRFVDIGLGAHRTKCKIHEKFRLIVVSEKKTVYEKYPIPLINRLEKHFVKIETLLLPSQIRVSKTLHQWADRFCEQKQRHFGKQNTPLRLSEAFRGFHDDACAAIILYLWEGESGNGVDEDEVFDHGKRILLWCATPEAIVRTRSSALTEEEKEAVWNIYWHEQHHRSFSEYIKNQETGRVIFSQVTTHAKLLSTSDKIELSNKTEISHNSIFLENLEAFDTEQQFVLKIRSHIDKCRDRLNYREGRSLLIVMCEYNYFNANLIACARNCLADECASQAKNLRQFNVVFLVRLARDGFTEGNMAFTGFQCGHWTSVHIDNLRDSDVPPIPTMTDVSVGKMLKKIISRKQDVSDSDSSADIITGIDSFMRNVLLHCVPPAMARVKYPAIVAERSLRMIEVLQTLLYEADTDGNRLTFSNCLSGLLVTFLTVVEENFGIPQDLSEWLLKVSLQKDAILRAGTFSDACVKHIQGKLEPLLADTIAYIDRNQNLDILTRDVGTWKYEFWLEVLSSKNVLALHTRDMLCSKSTSGNGEVTIRTSGFEGRIFQNKLPFSWLLFESIHPEAVSKTTSKNIGRKDESGIGGTEAILKKTELGKIISKFTEAAGDGFILAYVEDIIQMVTEPTCESETRILNYIVCGELQKRMNEEEEDISLIRKLLLVYETVVEMQSTFSTLRAAGQAVRCFTNDAEAFYQNWKTVAVDSVPKYDGLQRVMLQLLEFILERISEKTERLNVSEDQREFLKRTHTCRPVIEQLFTKYGTISEITNRCKKVWSRISIVKLFIEHLCLSNTIEGPLLELCGTLWLYLRQNSNLKELHTLKEVEKFLKICNHEILKSLFGDFERCERCKSTRKTIGTMVPLSCEHLVCSSCFKEIRTTGIGKNCPTCKEFIDLDFDRNTSQSFGVNKLKSYKTFQRRCNVFYMDIITQMCFADGEPPSDEVIRHLLLLITSDQQQSSSEQIRITQKLTVFVDSVDKTPVFRSFLLKLLVRSCEEAVVDHLNEYIAKATNIINRTKGNTEDTILQLYVMVVQCFEDVLFEDSVKTNEVQHAIKCLRKASLAKKETTIALVYDLAHIRYGLGMLAKYIHDGTIDVTNNRQGSTKRDVETLIQTLVAAIADGNEMPRIYLLKQIYRGYGFQSLQQFCFSDNETIKQLSSPLGNMLNELPDRYLIFGEEYKLYKDALFACISTKNTSHLQGMSAVATKEKCVLLGLALHREITMKLAAGDLDEEQIKSIGEYLERNKILSDLNRRLLENKLSSSPNLLNLSADMDPFIQEIHCLMVHFLCVLTIIFNTQNSIVQPFIDLISAPEQLQDSFLPTMPQIDENLLNELKRIINGSRNDSYNQHRVYSCPNGHPYLIGDCGRAVQQSVCREPRCGAPIGGKSMHVLIDTNVEGIVREIGHTLGAAKQVITTDPVRQLSGAATGILRLLTHMALYLGTLSNKEVVQFLIKKGLENYEVETFLSKHIERDIHFIGDVLNRCSDDVFIMVHVIIQNIIGETNRGYHWKNDDFKMCAADTRNKWEQDISERLLQPVVSTAETVIQSSIEHIGRHNRFASKTFDKILEINQQPTQIEARLQDKPSIWQYKSRISIEDMKNKFFSSTKRDSDRQYVVLEKFLRQEFCLRGLKYVPGIKRLQKLLLQQYNRNIDRKQVDNITVDTVLSEETVGNQYSGLIQNFTEAWDICRESLSKYVCRTKYGSIIVPKRYCLMRITGETKLSMLLPSQSGPGLCSFALMQFLLKQHNDIVEFHRAEKSVPSSMQISMNDVTVSDLVMFDRTHDLLPLVLANCQYSFEIGKGTLVEYDFANLEKQIIERYLYAKPTFRFSKKDLEEAKEMVYRFDSTNSSTFKSLHNLIPQERIEETTKHQIALDFRYLTEISRTIDNLNIAINFLKSLGANDNKMLLVSFMEDVLKLQNPLLSVRASQTCSLQHSRSLWLLLTRRKAMEHVSHGQPITVVFDGIAKDGIFGPIDKQTEDMLIDCFKSISLESLDSLSEVIFECIVMRLSVHENTDDDDYVDISQHSLKETIEFDDSLNIDEMTHVKAVLDQLASNPFPDHIICSQSGMTCMVAFRIINDRKKGGAKYK